MDQYRQLIKENIDYDLLLTEHPYDEEMLEGYVELMVEICCSRRDFIRIAGDEVATGVVKSRFLKLNITVIDLISPPRRAISKGGAVSGSKLPILPTKYGRAGLVISAAMIGAKVPKTAQETYAIMSENHTPKAKNLMYAQQLQYLPQGIKTVEDLASVIENKLKPVRYAVIIHDQETDDQGQPNLNQIDGVDQLVRRISLTVEMTGRRIQAMQYVPFYLCPATGSYCAIPGTERPNPYSCLARPTPPNQAKDIYNSIFED